MKNYNINLNEKTILVTGAAGFIGSYLSKRLIKEYQNIKVIGFDNINDYYDVNIKKERLKDLTVQNQFDFIKGDLADQDIIGAVFEKYRPQIVINLAAQAGVRYSITNPEAYINSNIIGFYNILECCRHSPVQHLVYASSSSVYGLNRKIPYSEKDQVDKPVSLYAATKKSNELMAYSYSKLYDIPSTGLRFFTVYGPAGRPDMAYFSFADKMRKRQKIQLYNFGKCRRDFTYIDDIVEGITCVMQRSPDLDELGVRYKIYNIGNNHPVDLLEFVDILHRKLLDAGVLPKNYDLEKYKELVPMQPGDVDITYADIDELGKDFGFKPETSLEMGLWKFAEWYKQFIDEGEKDRREQE